MEVRQLRCPGRPHLVCYNITPICSPGPLLSPILERWQGVFVNPAGEKPILVDLLDANNTNTSCPANPAIDLLTQAVTCPGAYGLLCVTQTTAPVDHRNWLPIVIILLALLLVHGFAALAFHFYRSLQMQQLSDSMVNEAVEHFQVQMVKQLVPSMAVSSYRFRGMKAVPEAAQISLAFQDLSFHTRDSKCILEGVTGELMAGSMCALMGPSGCGKTTLMRVLAGKARDGRVSGEIEINHRPGSVHAIRHVTGYVPQDDVVHETLTVREQIAYSARLRNPASTTRSRLDRIVEDVLAVMQIQHIQQRVVGGVVERGISGGQRKRVNIGLELAACPRLLFLDEPTSGLDATSALGIIHSMKSLAELGMTVAMVIHQPRYSLFTLFDEALLLGPGGRTVYMGWACGAKPYFERLGYQMPENENPADWFMDIICGEAPNQLIPEMNHQMLFERWAAEESPLHRERQGRTCRSWTDLDDTNVFRAALSEAWHRIDMDGDGELTQEELEKVLEDLCGVTPPEVVMSELFARMAGGAGIVGKQEFLDFVVGLRSNIAVDKKAQTLRKFADVRRRASTLRLIAEDVEDSMDNTSESSEDSSDEGSTRALTPRTATSSMVFRNVTTLLADHGLAAAATPGHAAQYAILLKRAWVQQWRLRRPRFGSHCLVAFAAIVLGCLTHGKIKVSDSTMPLNIFLGHTVLALLTAISCLNCFGRDRPVFWREASSGISILSFYLSRITADALDVTSQSLLYSVCWCLSVGAEEQMEVVYLPSFLLTSFVAAAWGYLVSTLVSPQSSTLTVAVVIMIFGCALGMPNQLVAVMSHLRKLGDYGGGAMNCHASMFVWSTGMAYLRAVEAGGGKDMVPIGPARRLLQAYSKATSIGGEQHQQLACAVVLLSMGGALLVFGYLGLRFRHRHRHT